MNYVASKEGTERFRVLRCPPALARKDCGGPVLLPIIGDDRLGGAAQQRADEVRQQKVRPCAHVADKSVEQVDQSP